MSLSIALLERSVVTAEVAVRTIACGTSMDWPRQLVATVKGAFVGVDAVHSQKVASRHYLPVKHGLYVLIHSFPPVLGSACGGPATENGRIALFVVRGGEGGAS